MKTTGVFKANGLKHPGAGYRKRADAAKNGEHHQATSANLHNALDIVWERALRKADFEAQHGPVKILWKDGKPVNPQ